MKGLQTNRTQREIDRERPKEEVKRCRTCKTVLVGKNARDVGQCLPCFLRKTNLMTKKNNL